MKAIATLIDMIMRTYNGNGGGLVGAGVGGEHCQLRRLAPLLLTRHYVTTFRMPSNRTEFMQ